jgi:hypothetical protein
MEGPIPISTHRNVLLSLVRWQARRLVRAEVSYFRLALDAHLTGQARAWQRAETARRWAREWAEGLSDDLAELFRLGLSHQGVRLVEAAADEIETARSGIARAERRAGRQVPTIPTASGESAPYIRQEITR